MGLVSTLYKSKIRHSQQSIKIQFWFEKQMCLATLNRVVLRMGITSLHWRTWYGTLIKL